MQGITCSLGYMASIVVCLLLADDELRAKLTEPLLRRYHRWRRIREARRRHVVLDRYARTEGR